MVAAFKTQKSEIGLDAILDKGAFDLKRILEFEPDFLHHGHDQGVVAEKAGLLADRRGRFHQAFGNYPVRYS